MGLQQPQTNPAGDRLSTNEMGRNEFMAGLAQDRDLALNCLAKQLDFPYQPLRQHVAMLLAPLHKC